jgi:transposase-like protein
MKMSQQAGESAASEGRGGTPPERWSAQGKTEVVLRLLRGEDLGEVSREMRVSPAALEEWRRVFLENGQQGLKTRSRDPAERELTRTRAKLGELTMRMELATELLEKRGYGDELKRLLKRGYE